MIDNTSTPDTQEPPSNQSPSSPLPEERIHLSSKKKTNRDPFWKTVPIGMVKGRDRTGARYAWIKGRPTTAAINAGLPVGKNYNLIFVKDGQRTQRTYEITYVSPLDISKTFKIRVAASSLRALFREATFAIGNLRATKTTENFSLHFTAVSQKEGMTEEIVSIPLAEELSDRQKPSTDEPVEPIFVED